MPRIRSVKPGFFTTHDFANVPIEARFLLIGLFTEADDEGRLIDSTKMLAGSLFPHDDKVTAARVDGWLKKLVGARKIVRYHAPDGGRYIAIVNWTKHQKISHPTPSVLPSPPAALPNRSGAPPDPICPEVEVEVDREVEQGGGSGTDVDTTTNAFHRGAPEGGRSLTQDGYHDPVAGLAAVIRARGTDL